MNRQAEDCSINGREALEAPVFAVLADDFIEGGDFFGGALKELVCESARRVGGFGAFPEFRFQFGGILLAHVPLEEHLHRKLAGFGTESHVTCAAVSQSKRLAPILILARAACARAAPSPWRRAPLQILCCRP